MQKLKVGIIGFGLSGAVFHAPVISQVKQLELAAVASRQPEKVKYAYPLATVYAEPEQLIDDGNIDLVVICSPNESHYPLAKMALDAKKHVVIEKPFVSNRTQGEELIHLAHRKNLLLSVYHNRRWDNDFLALQECISQDRLGDINYCEIRFERFRPEVNSAKWREQQLAGSGILYDLGSHLIDQALCLFGWPQSIYADITTQRVDAVVDDYFHIILGYEGLRVVLHAGAVVKKSGPRFIAHGSKGSFIKYGQDPQESLLRALHEKTEVDPLFGVKNYLDNVMEITVDAGGHDIEGKINLPMGRYREYYEKMYFAILEKSQPPVSAYDGLNVIKIIELAVRSHDEGRRLSI
ncbi:MAG TPA: oxidoreductase [Gammaproteobacteria bacterium]|nr:oxidoreductase [Gammaproteobacteria bacterium]